MLDCIDLIEANTKYNAKLKVGTVTFFKDLL